MENVDWNLCFLCQEDVSTKYFSNYVYITKTNFSLDIKMEISYLGFELLISKIMLSIHHTCTLNYNEQKCKTLVDDIARGNQDGSSGVKKSLLEIHFP